jgi:hypothetical protein
LPTDKAKPSSGRSMRIALSTARAGAGPSAATLKNNRDGPEIPAIAASASSASAKKRSATSSSRRPAGVSLIALPWRKNSGVA